ncbi:MAG: prolipoprotein diacylglyceryl transferase [Candidatus Riflebacteria bacterium]|nr:prolipoprotein diacylglyceryl transferase [Candidatus Riflebacteria bacterium]
MYPILFKLGSVTLYTHGAVAVAATLAGLVVSARIARRERVDDAIVWNYGLLVLPCAIVGGGLMMGIFDLLGPGGPSSTIWSRLDLNSAGAAYGGILLNTVVAVAFARVHRVPFGKLADILVPGLALGHGLWRVGCFLAGCCYGSQTTLPWAVTYSDPVAHQFNGTPLGLPVHPTQLYEALVVMVILLVLIARRERKRFDGELVLIYFTLYPLGRFVIEMFRGDAAPWSGSGLTTSQALSTVLFTIATAALLGLRSRRRPA